MTGCRENNKIRVFNLTLNRSATSVISNDPNVTVTQLSPTIKLSINVSGSGGKTFNASLNLSSSLASDNFDSYTTGNVLGNDQGWYVSTTDANETVTTAEVPSVTDKKYETV